MARRVSRSTRSARRTKHARHITACAYWRAASDADNSGRMVDPVARADNGAYAATDAQIDTYTADLAVLRVAFDRCARAHGGDADAARATLEAQN